MQKQGVEPRMCNLRVEEGGSWGLQPGWPVSPDGEVQVQKGLVSKMHPPLSTPHIHLRMCTLTHADTSVSSDDL